MHEYEAKFINIDVAKLRENLNNLGFIRVKEESLMARKAYGLKDNPNKWARVRDEGDKITMTIKEEDKTLGIHGVKEAEVVVDNFEMACSFLEFCGFYEKAYQETKREIWAKGSVEIMIDTWPGLKPFIEIESDAVDQVEKTAIALGFDMKNAFYGGVGNIYEHLYSLDVNHLPVITFAQPPVALEGN